MSSERERDFAAAENLRRLLPSTGGSEHREWIDACESSSPRALAGFLAIVDRPPGHNTDAKRDAARLVAAAKIAENLADRIDALERVATRLEKRALWVAAAGLLVSAVGVALAAIQVSG